jgi:hypothetical protein
LNIQQLPCRVAAFLYGRFTATFVPSFKITIFQQISGLPMKTAAQYVKDSDGKT